MQFTLFAERMSDLVMELLDPRLDETRRVAAGDKLTREIQSDYVDFADIAVITDSLALGMKMLKNEKRLPVRPNDFVFTDEPLVRVATVFTAIGERIEKIADHSATRQDRDIIADFRRQQGIDDFRRDLINDIKNHDLKAMSGFIDKLAESAENLHEADDDLVQGQSTLLDIPMAIVAQFYFAAGHRLGDLTKYCKVFD